MSEDLSERLRGSMFEDGNRVRFESPVDEAARRWWLGKFYDPHRLTPEGMGDLITASVTGDKSILYRSIDGRAERFMLRVEGRLGEPGDLWFVERTLELSGALFNADEMFVAEAGRGRGAGRRLMRDLLEASAVLGVERIKVQAQKVGRYTWLRMGFRPDDGSWHDMRRHLAVAMLNYEDALGADRSREIASLVARGRPEIANAIAALRDPVPSVSLRDPNTGERLIAPLGRVLFIDASPDWYGELSLRDRDGLEMARAYAREVS